MKINVKWYDLDKHGNQWGYIGNFEIDAKTMQDLYLQVKNHFEKYVKINDIYLCNYANDDKTILNSDNIQYVACEIEYIARNNLEKNILYFEDFDD